MQEAVESPNIWVGDLDRGNGKFREQKRADGSFTYLRAEQSAAARRSARHMMGRTAPAAGSNSEYAEKRSAPPQTRRGTCVARVLHDPNDTDTADYR